MVNAFFNAIGGAEAFQNIKELEQEMSLVAPGMPGAVSMYSKKIVPSYYVTEQSMQGMTLMKVEYKDGEANSSGMRGNATLEGDELASTAKEAKYVISELAWLDDMSSITFDGQTLMAGKDVYQITDGDAVHYFDVATGLLHMSTETTITVVGKAQDVAGKLSAFGAVEYFDANGATRMLQPSSLRQKV